MKSILKKDRVLVILALLGLLASLFPLGSRIRAEENNKYYDIILDYSSLRAMARQSSQTEDEWLDLFRSLGVDKVWLKVGDTEVLTPIGEVRTGDCVVVRTGHMIPLDGRVVAGEMSVNQASMTGESCAVRKSVGAPVYAGTVVEDGECTVRIEKAAGDGRYDRIVHMIEESEKLKSATEDKASHLADKLVQGSEPTCLEARFAASRKKCETPSARAAWERRYRAARDILDEYQLNWGQTQ